MNVTIITPVYNDEATLEACLEAIKHLETPCDIQHIIVDDGSTDASPALAQNYADTHTGVLLIRKENGGEASALNKGLEAATGDFVATIEADVEPETGWLVKLLPEFEDETIAGAGGILIPCASDSWVSRIAGYEVESKFHGQKRNPVHLTSAAAIYRREVLQQMNGYDESLRNSTLDVDLNQRILQSGFLLAYNKNAHAVHHYKTDFFDYLKRQYAYARFRPHLKTQMLYPRDRNIAWQIALTGLFLGSLPLLGMLPVVSFCLLLAIFGIQIPMLNNLFNRYRDPALFALPFVMLARNTMGAIGLAIGFANKWGLLQSNKKTPSVENSKQ